LPDPARPLRPAPPWRRRDAAWAVVAVVAAHAWLLVGGGDDDVPLRDDARVAVPLAVRSIVVPARVPVAAADARAVSAPPAAGAQARPRPMPRRAAAPAQDRAAADDPAVASRAAGTEGVEVAEPTPVEAGSTASGEVTADLAAVPAPLASAPVAAQVAAQTAPVFATRLPPAFDLRFEMRRGALAGEADLQWRPQPEGYELTLATRVLGLDAMGLASRGRFDPAGLAPERFVDRRRGRDRRAVNFDREAGVITYSGPQARHPLHPGAQDRLSWMVQLPAIVEAAPERFGAGERIVIFVTGARGDADLWTFVVQGIESVEVGSGAVRALKLTREPRKPYDTQVEIWLDPAHHHLPVRARLTTLPGGEALELTLAS
jgi:hypothetical protein